jgi:hypothetical protein
MPSTSSAASSCSSVRVPFSTYPCSSHDLPDRLALGQRLLGDLRGRLVAEVAVQRRDHRRRRLGQLAAPLDVRGDAVDAPVGQQPRRVGQQPHRLEHVAGHHRHHDVELEAARRARERHRRVVADHLRADHQGRLGHDRVHLARHDRRPGLQVRQVDLGQTGARAGAHPADVVADLRQRHRHGSQLAGQLDQAVAGTLGLEVVAGLGQWQVEVLGQSRTTVARTPAAC